MRFLVTGAAGFIGSHLVEAIVERGDEAVAVDSFTDYYDPARKRQNASSFEVAEVDLEERALDGLLAGVDGVFHLAGQPGVRSSFGADFALYVRRNVVASGRLFEAAARRRRRVVYASSSSVYGDRPDLPKREDQPTAPISPYAATKVTA